MDIPADQQARIDQLLDSQKDEKEKKEDECERNPPHPLAPPAPAPVVVDLLDDEFEDDWKKGNSDDEDW